MRRRRPRIGQRTDQRIDRPLAPPDPRACGHLGQSTCITCPRPTVRDRASTSPARARSAAAHRHPSAAFTVRQSIPSRRAISRCETPARRQRPDLSPLQRAAHLPSPPRGRSQRLWRPNRSPPFGRGRTFQFLQVAQYSLPGVNAPGEYRTPKIARDHAAKGRAAGRNVGHAFVPLWSERQPDDSRSAVVGYPRALLSVSAPGRLCGRTALVGVGRRVWLDLRPLLPRRAAPELAHTASCIFVSRAGAWAGPVWLEFATKDPLR